ncbi:MAG: hypothetical protein AABZ44_06605 [Elusimicrobiota bacterium]
MHIEATATFTRCYRQLPKEIQKKVKKALTVFEKNPAHPSLVHKKMGGQSDIYELRVSLNYRITYQKAGDTAYLRKVGTHDLLRHP